MDATLESEVKLSHRAIEAFDFTARKMVNNDLFFEMKAPPNVAVNLAYAFGDFNKLFVLPR